MRRTLLAASLCLAALAGSAHAQAPAASPAPSKDPAAAPAGSYVLDTRHASLIAKIGHFGFSNYALRFNKFDASYDYNPAKPEATKISVTIDPTSVDTGLKTFDPEIASAKILDAPKYPQITFVSTSVKRTGGDKGVVTGDLTFFGVTKPVALDVIFNGSGPAMGNVQKMGFSATGSFKRSDFGFNFLQGKLADRVDIAIEAEFNKKP